MGGISEKSIDFLNRISKSDTGGLLSYEQYKALSKKPQGHFCTECKSWYKKYNADQRLQDPKWVDVFPVCKGSLESMPISLSEWESTGGSIEEYEVLHIENDPIQWAAAELGFITSGIDYDREGDERSMDRWYQDNMLRCSAQLKVHRCGRRTGKCLIKGTLVATPSGPKPIEDISIGDTVYDEHGNPIKVTDVHDQGLQIVEDLSSNGTLMATCTANHPWLTMHPRLEGTLLRNVSGFYKGTKIVRTEVNAPLGNVDEPYAYVLGAIIGDGSCRDTGLIVSTADESMVQKISSILNIPYRKCHKNNFSWYFSARAKKQIPYYTDYLHNKYAHEKYIPLEIVKTWNRSSLLEFVAGLIDTDGGILFTGSEIRISVDMQSLETLKALEYAFMALWQVKVNIGKDNRNKYVNGPVHHISIKHIYHCKRILKELQPHQAIQRKMYRPEFDLLVPNNFTPNAVGVTRSNSRMAHCYDLSVDSATNLYLLANGLVTHNTVSMRVDVLHALHHQDDFTVVLIAPFETQLIKFEEGLIELIEKSTTVKDNFKKWNKTKHTITFKNGSKLEGYCTGGDKQSKTADRVRGAGASMIVIDEADYISEDALQAVLAVMSDDPKCRILVSSTPTGKRGFFYNWCTDKTIGFKEFVFFSHVSPSYTKQADNLYRSTLSEDRYRKEYLAEFGTLVDALLTPECINRAVESYDMQELRAQGPKANCKYIIGVDWNGRRVGTVIVCVEWNPMTGKYKMVDKVVVKDTEYNYENSCIASMKMFDHWGANYMYVDSGHGDMQVEMMTKTARQLGNVRMQKGIVPVQMGGYQVIKDPLTGLDVKKHTKEFAINLMVNCFENNRVTVPYSETYKDDDEDWGIVPQLYDLAVESINDMGRTKYVEAVDHTMTALYLALLGFHMKLTDIGRVNHDPAAVIISQGDLKKLPGGIVIEGGAKRDRERSKDKAIKPNEFVMRSNKIDTGYRGSQRIVNADDVEWKSGVPMYKHDSRIASVPTRNLGVIQRKSF